MGRSDGRMSNGRKCPPEGRTGVPHTVRALRCMAHFPPLPPNKQTPRLTTWPASRPPDWAPFFTTHDDSNDQLGPAAFSIPVPNRCIPLWSCFTEALRSTPTTTKSGTALAPNGPCSLHVPFPILRILLLNSFVLIPLCASPVHTHAQVPTFIELGIAVYYSANRYIFATVPTLPYLLSTISRFLKTCP